MYAIIKLTKKNIHTLYKKCSSFVRVEQVFKDNEKKKVQYVYMQDVINKRRLYIDMARKMGDLYEEMLKKAFFFRMSTEKIFANCPGYKFIESDSIFKGFFFLFIYKDFVLREIIA